MRIAAHRVLIDCLFWAQVIRLKMRDDQYADKKGKPRTRITKFWMDCLTRQLGLRATAEKEHEELCRSVLRFKVRRSTKTTLLKPLDHPGTTPAKLKLVHKDSRRSRYRPYPP